MSANFQIYTHRNSENLHIKLLGDFDDASACELIDILEKNSEDDLRVFVHTSNLNEISPSGIDSFRQDINRLKNFAEISRAERSKVMLPSTMKIIGVTAPNVKKIVKEFKPEIKNWLPEKVLEFNKDLVKTKILECNQVVFLLLYQIKKI